MDFIPNEITREGTVKIRIEAVGGDLDRVACRYPLSFMDEMALQLTPAIEAATGTYGIADSSVELIMAFATTTFMEHISGNVTYRRLLLIDSVSAPRDFWVKWTRLDVIDGEYNSNNILFELGEDVEHKIREKEYRYLLQSGGEKYHNSMSRKKATEWREVIRRAAKRGEIGKIEVDLELAPETLEIEELIADLLGKKVTPKAEPIKDEIPYIHSDESEFALALEKMRMVVEQDDENSEPEIPNEECSAQVDEAVEIIFEEEPELAEEKSEEEEIDIFDFAEDDASDEEFADMPVEELILEEEPEEESEIIEEPELEIEIIEEEPEVESEIIEEPELEIEIIEEEPEVEIEIIEEEPELEIEIIEEEPEVESEIAEEEPELKIEIIEEELEEESEIIEEEPEVESEIAEEKPEVTEPVSIADRVADIRAELEVKIRLEYETKAREKAEAELIELRRSHEKLRRESEEAITLLVKENERLRMEYEHFVSQTESERLARNAEEARLRLEEQQLRAQIEAQLRAEAAERERLAESARMAMDEQRRLEAENARIARQIEEEERAEAERKRIEEHERELEALRQAEVERIRREDEEARARARDAMPEMGDGRYSYTSKTVRFIFRHSVDPNITTRIQEIIKATVDYYGKDGVYLRIRASVPDTHTVLLEFAQIPIEEMSLLGNIIKILGNSGLGIAKAIIE